MEIVVGELECALVHQENHDDLEKGGLSFCWIDGIVVQQFVQGTRAPFEMNGLGRESEYTGNGRRTINIIFTACAIITTRFIVVVIVGSIIIIT